VAIMWALGYIFLGFMAVHRVLSFADIAGSLPSLLPLAGLGLLAGRIGDILGTVGALLCGDNAIILVTVTAATAILAILVFLKIYQRLYMPAPTGEQVDQLRLRRFESQHGLSIREREVFRLLISGSTNQEIAGRLFVSESTVKFHVTNILRKTGCRSRNEVLALCDSFPAHLE
jgi:DNA-binding CsgD family transcriptional regulator